MTKLTIPFGALQAACAKRSLTAKLERFDCGETVVVIKAPAVILRVTRECGDSDTASEAAGVWLVDHGFLTLEDFEGGE